MDLDPDCSLTLLLITYVLPLKKCLISFSLDLDSDCSKTLSLILYVFP